MNHALVYRLVARLAQEVGSRNVRSRSFRDFAEGAAVVLGGSDEDAQIAVDRIIRRMDRLIAENARQEVDRDFLVPYERRAKMIRRSRQRVFGA